METKRDLDITTTIIPALTARIHFGEIMEKVAKNQQRFLVERRGSPTLVMLSVEDYLTNILKEPELLKELHKKTKAAGVDRITMKEIDQEVAAARKSFSEFKRIKVLSPAEFTEVISKELLR
ncbi:type II toxin-antitoxin system Phd/YefM family antitoxin [bacterium]|nr:type II toxin-antitoxin system Phd/YefM family antitoxin [bacterium]